MDNTNYIALMASYVVPEMNVGDHLIRENIETEQIENQEENKICCL